MTNYAKHETDEVAAIVRDTFSYDPKSGVLTRLKASKYQKRLEGKPAGSKCSDGQGNVYLRVRFGKSQMLVHRMGWMLHYGAWPEKHLDHENGVGTDNRLSNLREVSNSGNHMNRKRRKSNSKSKHCGVFFDPNSRKWRSHIGVEGKRFYLGVFETISEAISARKQAEVKYCFHPNHGREK